MRLESCKTLKEDVLEIGRVVLLGDFNASVGKSTDVDGIFGEDTCGNSSLVDGVCPSLSKAEPIPEVSQSLPIL